MNDSNRQRIAVLSTSENLCNQVHQQLRNAGNAVSGDWYQSLDKFAEQLADQPPDLVLCEEDLVEDAPQRVMRLLREYDDDLPLVIVGERPSELRSVGALNIGARDFVCSRSPQMLCQVCLRELAVFADRRRMRALFERVEAAETMARSVLRDSGDPMVIVQEGILVDVNPAFAAILGGNADDMLALPLLDIVAEPDQALIRGIAKRARESESPTKVLHGEARLRLANGQLTPSQRLEFSATEFDDEPAIRMTLRRQEGSDGMAHGTREALFEALAPQAAPSDGFSRGVIFVTVDQFDQLESRIGFLDAEDVLKAIHSMIAPQQSPGDRVYQFSPSELVIVGRRDSADGIKAFAEAVRTTVADQTITTAQHETKATISVVAYPMGAEEDAQTLLEKLRNLSKELSRGGGNATEFVGAQAEESERRKAAETRARSIKNAIEQNRLRLVYQPIASLEGTTEHINDSHVRMFDADGNEYTATEFLPVAIEFGLMPDIDQWVAKAAIQALADDDDGDSVVFVRFSKETLQKPKAFIKTVQSGMKAANIAPGRFVIELSERLLMDNLGKATKLMEELRKSGVDLVIDRFGASSHSMRLLSDFDPVYIKLDPSFTRSMTGSGGEAKHSAFHEIIEEAKSCGIKTIAEHIEDANGMAKLWQLGINYVQGNHVQEPEVVLAAA